MSLFYLISFARSPRRGLRVLAALFKQDFQARTVLEQRLKEGAERWRSDRRERLSQELAWVRSRDVRPSGASPCTREPKVRRVRTPGSAPAGPRLLPATTAGRRPRTALGYRRPASRLRRVP